MPALSSRTCRFLRFTAFIMLVYTSLDLYAATIFSTAAGGDWSQGTTWSGGVAPSSTDEVVINGTVSLHSSLSCAALTIAQAGVLQNGGSLGWVTLRVEGTLSNSGTIRNNPAGNELRLELIGDIVNNGIWQPSQTYIASQQTQTIAQAEGTAFTGAIRKEDAAGYADSVPLVAKSDLVFDVTLFDFQGYKEGTYFPGTLDMAGHDLTLRGATPLSRAVVKRIGVFSCRDSASLTSTTIDDPVVLGGRFSASDSKVTFTGPVTVRDTLMNAGDPGWVTVRFMDSLINDGVIMNNPAGNELHLELTGDIVNNGIWQPSQTYIASQQTQTIAQAAAADLKVH